MKIALSLFILTLFVLVGCTKNDDDTPVVNSIKLDEKSVQLVEAGNEFGLDLFQRIYAGETESNNIMVSPLSVSVALAMTYNGANTETKRAMEETLKVYGLSPEDINQSYKNLLQALKSLDPKVVLEIANAIFYRQGFQVENDFISINRNYYNAEVDALDFSSRAALNTINDWVADKTHDKIEKIIDKISGDHVMFLLNAIYFNGMWQQKFDEDDTRDLPFYAESGGTVNVPTMQKTDAIPYTSNDLFSAVKLAYGAGNYSMYVFLPHQNIPIEDIIGELNQNTWNTWMNNFGSVAEVDVKLPRLKYEYEIQLNEVLSDMGMGIAFSENADFTAMGKGSGHLKIDYVKHKTYIDVNEKGTEAAAVTVVAMEVTSVGPKQNIQFTVDRPFFYAITEKDTGAILFMGTVKNPKN